MPRSTWTDRSGTITAGGTAQQIMAAPAEADDREYLVIQNVSSGDLWVNFGVVAVQSQPSIKLIPGASLELSYAGNGYCPSQFVSIIGATTGQAFVAKETP
jgi:hypothetical protein